MRRVTLLWLAALVLVARPAMADLEEEVRSAGQAIRAWDIPAASTAVDRAMEAAPDDVGVLVVAGHLRLMQGRYADAVELLARAVHSGAAEDPYARHLLDLAISTEEETRGYREHTTSGGHFLIRHAPGLDEAMVPYVDEVLEQAWAQLVPIFDHAPPTPVRVEIYPRVEVLGAVSSLTVDEIKTSGTIALCKYDRLMITSPRDLVYGYGWADTLAHEFIHMLVTQKSRNTVPIWLHEGLAKYYEARWRPDVVPKLERTSEDLLARALAEDRLISFAEMSPSMAKLPSQEATGTAFAEVFTVIEFLVSRRGEESGRLLVEAMAGGASDRDAVAEVSGVPWPRFEPAWKRHLQQSNLRTLDDKFDQRLLFKGSDSEADELAALDGEKARRFVWLGDQMRLRDKYKAAAKQYQKAVQEVGDTTPIIQAKLGHALLKLGRLVEAVDALQRPLAVYPDYVLLRLYLGAGLLRLGRWADAREHLEAAVRLNPFDPDVHGHLAAVYMELGRPDLVEREMRIHALLRDQP